MTRESKHSLIHRVGVQVTCLLLQHTDRHCAQILAIKQRTRLCSTPQEHDAVDNNITSQSFGSALIPCHNLVDKLVTSSSETGEEQHSQERERTPFSISSIVPSFTHIPHNDALHQVRVVPPLVR